MVNLSDLGITHVIEQGNLLICHTDEGAFAIPSHDDLHAVILAYRQAVGLPVVSMGVALAKEDSNE
jgi:hypothetical protein